MIVAIIILLLPLLVLFLMATYIEFVDGELNREKFRLSALHFRKEITTEQYFEYIKYFKKHRKTAVNKGKLK